MKTPKEIISILHKGISSFYNESIPIPSKRLAILSTQHSIIGWNHLARERISKCFTKYMNRLYSTNNISSFSGKGWTKEVSKFLILTHVDAWKNHYEIVLNSKSKIILSLKHQSLLITVDSLFNKSSQLSIEVRIWLPDEQQEIKSLQLRRLKTWIKNTKLLLKLSKLYQINTKKITEYFQPKVNQVESK